MSKQYEYETVSFTFKGQRYWCRGLTLEEAIEKKLILKKQLEDGEVGITKDITVKRWATEWLNTYKKGNVSDKVFADYKSKFERFLYPAVGNLKIGDVTDMHLQRIVNNLTFGKSNTNKMVQLIKGIFRQARISRLIIFDPAEGIMTPKKKEGSHRSITDTERKYILQLAETHKAGLLIRVLLYCGLRPGEAIALDWRDIDFKQGRINVTKAKESGSDRIKEPKSKAGIRSVPVPPRLLADLKAACGSPFEPVFTKQTKKERHTGSTLCSLWQNFKRELDILMGAKVYRNQIILSVVASDLMLYCLRHTYGTDLQKAGVSINMAKYLMGHSDIGVTANIYTHTTEDMIDDAAEKINSIYV